MNGNTLYIFQFKLLSGLLHTYTCADKMIDFKWEPSSLILNDIHKCKEERWVT